MDTVGRVVFSLTVAASDPEDILSELDPKVVTAFVDNHYLAAALKEKKENKTFHLHLESFRVGRDHFLLCLDGRQHLDAFSDT